MELLSPAGSLEKLEFAYRWGADAAYTGLPLFSLRTRAEQLDDSFPEHGEKIAAIKSGKKLYVALNIYFKNRDLELLPDQLARVASWPIDAFILSEAALIPLVREYFPKAEFHLSTQANCTNWRAAKMYHDMGFSRVVPARELSLEEIAEIKQRVPELELEVFAHGAMCLAYAGRCILSAEATGRSANRGDCAHNCRWPYRVLLEEESRPGETISLEEGETASSSYSFLLSSKDLCLVDHLEALRQAGVDAIKIEGRIKSVLYTAFVTRAYRQALDHPGEENPWKKDLFSLSHREYGTGFLFDGSARNIVSGGEHYLRGAQFIGTLVEPPAHAVQPVADACWGEAFAVRVRHAFGPDGPLLLDGPAGGTISLDANSFRVCTFDGLEATRIASEHGGWLQFSRTSGDPSSSYLERASPFWVIRRPVEGANPTK